MTIYNLSELAKNAGITLQEAGLAVMLKTDASSIALTGDEPVISDTYIGKASKAIAEYAVEKNSLQKEVERLQARVAELEVLVDKLMKR